MDYQPIIEAVLSILSIVNIGFVRNVRNRIIGEVNSVVMAQIQPVLTALTHQSELLTRQMADTEMILEVMQTSGQDDAEKFRLLIKSVESISDTQEEILQRVTNLEVHHH